MRFSSSLAVVVLLACGGDGPAGISDSLDVRVQGRLERGLQVQVQVFSADGAVSDADLASDPPGAVQWSPGGGAVLLTAGEVTFTARSGTAAGSATVTVAPPPVLVFESLASGVRDVWRMALDGADAVNLTAHPSEDASPSVANGRVWFLSYRTAPAAVFSIPASGGSAVQETGGGEYAEPAVSPDGQRLLFLRQVGGVSKVFVSERDGSAARRLTSSDGGIIEVSPRWSSDGQKVAFVSTASGNADVWMGPVEGGNASALGATSQPEVEPAWSPQGERIVFVRAMGDETDLYTVPASGGVAVRLTSIPGVVSRPAWLTDGRVVFMVGQGTSARLHWLDPAAPAEVHMVPHTVDVAGAPRELR